MFLWWRRKKFKEVATTVLEMKRVRSRPTQRDATLHIDRLIRNFGDLPLSKITEPHWNKYILAEQTRKPRTFRGDKTYMRMILLYGVRERIIERSIRLDIPDVPSDRGREVSAKELSRLLKVAPQDLGFQIRIAWKMGLRLGEMLRLRWNQFDWENRVVILQATDTKTKRKRLVPIPNDVFRQAKVRHRRSQSPNVFPSCKDPNRSRSSNKSAWIRCKRRAGVTARWHDLRHTCCTRMLRKNVPLHVVKTFLGMSEVVANRIYAHANLKDLRAASRKLSL